ncbi:YwqG family protein [Porcipelethomonas sp.]|uniref:YwqG family protein n=1 Tax=Porcipelethomonas sp. TaxID=2981675 RepID=UPI003EFAEB51
MGFFDKFKKKKDDLTSELENYKSDSAKSSEDDNIQQSLDEMSAARKILKEIYDETSVNCVTMELTDAKPSIFESKLGGMGYIPHDGNFPQDSKGNQLRLLAQIKCSDISLEDFPKQGLLQFWILNNDLSGADFENNTKQDSFRIVYHKNIDNSVTEEEVKSKFSRNEFDDDDMMPVTGEYGVTFTADTDFMSDNDYKFNKIFCDKYNKLNSPKTISTMYNVECDLDEIEEYTTGSEKAFGHKIGGYPGFTQYDPRDEGDTHDFLLLQLDSDFDDDDDKIMWGDSGICNFFISREKLKNLDFSDVLYNWDCC